ncbi:MAG: hypothetical protein IH944_13000 [Armatimonadetes bacterium]|nr:hypothetical protein [Armatimonadota bacterium]
MVKRRRRWILLGVGLFVAAVAALLFLGLREDPRYVKAARGLEQAREDARDAFGTLTWEEFREANGTEYRDDREGWRELKESIPASVAAFSDRDTTPTSTPAEVFREEEEWFRALEERIAPLALHHIFIGDWGDWTVESTIDARRVIQAMTVAIIGAADDGDVKSLERYTMLAFDVIAVAEQEQDTSTYFSGMINRSIVWEALVTASIKNRSNARVMSVARALVQKLPPTPSLAEVVAGDSRTLARLLEALHTLNPYQIGPWLEQGAYGYSSVDDLPTRFDRMKELWASLFSDEEVKMRRTGNRTADALEARYYESVVEAERLARLLSPVDGSGTEELRRHFIELDEINDLSYELATVLLGSQDTIVGWAISFGFERRSSEAAIDMLGRYPKYADLPDELPQDLALIDPYGSGRDALYRKTGTGFVIYSRWTNGRDDGFIESIFYGDEYVQFQARSGNELDRGTIVNYWLTKPDPRFFYSP